jgi:hypothetical protein
VNPTRVLEEQALLRDRLTTANYQAYMQPFLEDMARKGPGIMVTDEKGRPSGWHFCQREIKRLEMAESYYVSPDMVHLARWASTGLDDTDTFRHDLWPTDYGFIWLDGSLVSHEIWGRTITTQAMSWGRVNANGQSGMMAVFYTDMDDTRDEVNAQIKAKAIADGDWQKYQDMGNLHIHHIQFFRNGSDCGPETLTAPEDYQKWADGDLTTLAQTENDARFMLALLMLLNQTVTSVQTEDADKRLAKRMRRMKMPERVTVISLRRHEGARGEGESLVEWQHRWVVRGHWRWQPCGQDYPGAVQRDGKWVVRLYIAPYVKGPEGKPLKQSTKVYALVR